MQLLQREWMLQDFLTVKQVLAGKRNQKTAECNLGIWQLNVQWSVVRWVAPWYTPCGAWQALDGYSLSICIGFLSNPHYQTVTTNGPIRVLQHYMNAKKGPRGKIHLHMFHHCSQPQGAVDAVGGEYLLCRHFEFHELSFSTQDVPGSVDLQEADSRDLTLKRKTQKGLDIIYPVISEILGSWKKCLNYRYKQSLLCCISDYSCSLFTYVKPPSQSDSLHTAQYIDLSGYRNT